MPRYVVAAIFMQRFPRTSALGRIASGFDVLLAFAIAASYPLYVQLDALPRADDFGAPVPDRYPWAVAALLTSYLGYRCKGVGACFGVCALLSFSAVVAHTDAADITGVARPPVVLSAAAIVAVLAGRLLRRVASARSQVAAA